MKIIRKVCNGAVPELQLNQYISDNKIKREDILSITETIDGIILFYIKNKKVKPMK